MYAYSIEHTLNTCCVCLLNAHMTSYLLCYPLTSWWPSVKCWLSRASALNPPPLPVWAEGTL